MTRFGVSSDRAYDLLKCLGPSRMGGSRQEERAAQVTEALGTAACSEQFVIPFDVYTLGGFRVYGKSSFVLV